jgi:hypothetical protein
VTSDHDLDALAHAALLSAAKAMRGCIRYRQSLGRQLADAQRTSKEFGP